MTEKTKKITIEEWRQLGFHYDRDDELKRWIITGSPFGIKSFVIELIKYAENLNNDKQFEHDHLGPYGYLKIMTLDKAGIDRNSIFGSINYINKLAAIINSKLNDSMIDKNIIIKEEYTVNAEYCIDLRIKEYGFDPSTADEQLW